MSTGSKSAEYTTHVPGDVRQLRQNGLDLLNALFNGQGQANITKLFGDLSVPRTALQRQSTDAASNYLNQPAPEQQALNTAMPFLQNLLTQNPGQGMLDALKPSFDRNLAQANQQGGRFASGNAILRSRALDDFNLLGAQALQQGHNQQLQGVDALRLLSGQAGQNPFQRILGAGQLGASDAAQADLGTQRMAQIIGALLSGGLGAGVGAPVIQTKGQQAGWGQQGVQIGAQILGNLMGGG